MIASTSISAHKSDADGGKLIDLGQLFAPLRKHWLPSAITAAVVAALVVVLYLTMEREFSSIGLVGLERTEAEIAPTDTAVKPPAIDSAQVDTEVQVIQSPDVIGRAVKTMQPWRDPVFLAAFGDDKPMTAERAASIIKAQMEVKRQGLSYAISVTIASPSPELSAKLVNAVIDSYVNGQVTEKFAARGTQISLLKERLDQLRGDVLAADTAVAQFRARTNLVDINNDKTQAQAQMAALTNMLAEARAQDAAARARASGGGTELINMGAVNSLQQQVAQLAEQQSQLAKRYGPNHPDRIAIDSQLAQARTQLNAEQTRVRLAAAADVAVANQRTGAVQGSIGAVQQKMLAGNAAAVRLAELTREATSAQQIYEAFLDRYRRELANQGTEQSRSYVISLANPVFRPVSPDPVVFLVLAIVGGAVAGFLTALLLEALERGLRSRQEVEKELGLPVVAAIPDIATDVDGPNGAEAIGISAYVLDRDDSVTAESFRSIRNALKVGQQGQTVKTVAITSALPGEGKTANAIALARSSAAAGHRVLLIDCDIRRRVSSRTLRADDAPVGLIDVLAGRKSLDEAVVRESTSGAWLLPQTQGDEVPYDLVSSRAMGALLADLSQRYDLVVLDTAPALMVAEARGVCGLADATLFTVRWRRTPLRAARAALTQLERAGAEVSGVLLSQVDIKAASKAGEHMAYYRTYPAAS